MGLPEYDNADDLLLQSELQKGLLRGIESKYKFPQQLQTDVSLQIPERREELFKETKFSFYQAYYNSNVRFTEAGVNLITKLDLVRTGMPPEFMWTSTEALFAELVAVFNDFETNVHWRHRIGSSGKYTLGGGIIGYFRLLVGTERKLPLFILHIEDTLDLIWAEKSGDDIIFHAPKELLIIGSDLRELTIGVYASPVFDGSYRTWLMLDGEITPEQFMTVRPSTIAEARKAISNYRGPRTAGSLDNQQIKSLAVALGLQIKKIGGVDAAVLNPKKSRGFGR